MRIKHVAEFHEVLNFNPPVEIEVAVCELSFGVEITDHDGEVGEVHNAVLVEVPRIAGT